MTQARFSIGIDLGTTNCALAYVPLHVEAGAEILGIPQWESLYATTESTPLPSFLYLPEEAAVRQIQDGEAKNGEWMVGLLARKKAAESPGRVVHSAKSWLCHHSSDRLAEFLPWGSDDIARNRKKSITGHGNSSVIISTNPRSIITIGTITSTNMTLRFTPTTTPSRRSRLCWNR